MLTLLQALRIKKFVQCYDPSLLTCCPSRVTGTLLELGLNIVWVILSVLMETASAQHEKLLGIVLHQ
jgi:hypothetical protein